MKFLTYTGEIDIDIHDIVMALDDIFHREITNHTGVTVSHDAIRMFVLTIINENNKKILEFMQLEKDVKDLIEKNEKEFERKMKNGKTVDNLGGILNKFKYYYLNYILLKVPIGCGSGAYITKCDNCRHIYNDANCKCIRKDSGNPLVFEE